MVKLKYIQPVKSRGKTYYYFRRGEQSVRLPDNPETPEFAVAYWKARLGTGDKNVKTTFNNLIDDYYRSSKYTALGDFRNTWLPFERSRDRSFQEERPVGRFQNERSRPGSMRSEPGSGPRNTSSTDGATTRPRSWPRPGQRTLRSRPSPVTGRSKWHRNIGPKHIENRCRRKPKEEGENPKV